MDVELFGQVKLPWLRTFLALPNGIPSHDTFGRVFARLDPQQFERCFLGWVQAVMRRTEGEVVAVDGKVQRRSHDQRAGKTALDLVSAWADTTRLVLGQRAVEAASNEITVIPRLLEALTLEWCIVTVDAIGCQTAIAAAVIDQGGEGAAFARASPPRRRDAPVRPPHTDVV